MEQIRLSLKYPAYICIEYAILFTLNPNFSYSFIAFIFSSFTVKYISVQFFSFAIATASSNCESFTVIAIKGLVCMFVNCYTRKTDQHSLPFSYARKTYGCTEMSRWWGQIFFLCAGHGAQLGGGRPLWGRSSQPPTTSQSQGCSSWGGIWKKAEANLCTEEHEPNQACDDDKCAKQHEVR